MTRSALLTACAFLAAVVAFAAPHRAASPQDFGGELEAVNRPAPDFPKPGADVSGTTWINSLPLTLADLRGKVVLIDFWEFTCINCIRTFAQNKEWYARYGKDGFAIVGVHDPEFDIAYPAENVRAAVKRFGLPYPIVVDDLFTIWKSYANDSWPSRFLIDAKGTVRYHRDGEGADREFEEAIRKLLAEAHPGMKFSDPLPAEEDAFTRACGIPTGEMYVGDWYGRGVVANPEGYHAGKTIDYKAPDDVADGAAILGGPWETDKNGMIYRGKAQAPAEGSNRFAMRYHARELYAVLNASHGKPSRLYLQQDGKWLTRADAGVDVDWDEARRSFLEINESRMYYLAANSDLSGHRVDLFPTAPGLTINSFTFGNNCQTKFPHR